MTPMIFFVREKSMIYIVINKIVQSDRYILEKIIEYTKYPWYKILDINEPGEFPTRVEFTRAKVILVFNTTKKKSSFEEKLEAIYGEDIMMSLEKYVHIPTPDVFAKDIVLKQVVWDKITELTGVISTTIHTDLLPTRIPQELQAMIGGEKRVFNLQLNDWQLEIRPDNFPASKENSITFTEFLVLISAKSLFRFNKFDIVRT